MFPSFQSALDFDTGVSAMSDWDTHGDCQGAPQVGDGVAAEKAVMLRGNIESARSFGFLPKYSRSNIYIK